MAYVYSDYITITDTLARETRLRLHIQEVSALITPDVAKGGSSKSSGSVMALRTELLAELKSLVATNAAKRSARSSHANFNGAR
tara:strand:+ start:456 stop:707 length:252 start_codon:yes stop_codon:yes gene_type:complete